MVPELQYYPEQKLEIDLTKGEYEISVEDNGNELLGNYGNEDNESA
jgi:hypothetical protein